MVYIYLFAHPPSSSRVAQRQTFIHSFNHVEHHGGLPLYLYSDKAPRHVQAATAHHQPSTPCSEFFLQCSYYVAPSMAAQSGQQYISIKLTFLLLLLSRQQKQRKSHLPWLPGQVEVAAARNSHVISFRGAIHRAECPCIVACTADTTWNCSALAQPPRQYI